MGLRPPLSVPQLGESAATLPRAGVPFPQGRGTPSGSSQAVVSLLLWTGAHGTPHLGTLTPDSPICQPLECEAPGQDWESSQSASGTFLGLKGTLPLSGVLDGIPRDRQWLCGLRNQQSVAPNPDPRASALPHQVPPGTPPLSYQCHTPGLVWESRDL